LAPARIIDNNIPRITALTVISGNGLLTLSSLFDLTKKIRENKKGKSAN